MRVRSEGAPFIVGGLILILVAGLLGWTAVAALLALFTLFLLRFFRDPERIVPGSEGLMVAPADGRVVELEGGHLAIFMSIFDCHVNRAPVAGEVVDVVHTPGRFHPANKPQARENERNLIILKSGDQEIRVAQVAGMMARRILCWVRPGDRVEMGGKIGMILFGSRVEVDLPLGRWRFAVARGEKVRAGETVVAWEVKNER